MVPQGDKLGLILGSSGLRLSFAAGHRLGPHEILAPIGAGGMGDVYKARDTRLERTLTIKILREPLRVATGLFE